jgi:hypothetical protein
MNEHELFIKDKLNRIKDSIEGQLDIARNHIAQFYSIADEDIHKFTDDVMRIINWLGGMNKRAAHLISMTFEKEQAHQLATDHHQSLKNSLYDFCEYYMGILKEKDEKSNSFLLHLNQRINDITVHWIGLRIKIAGGERIEWDFETDRG